MNLPRIGAPVRGSTTGRPVMVLLDLLGRRMALRILWELREAPLTFRTLIDIAETNPAVLNTRLRELRDANLVAHEGGGYRLTELGRSLLTLLSPLMDWSETWRKSLSQPEP